MKIRTGFVSNSSSASFTLEWKLRRNDDFEGADDLLKFALKIMFECYGEDSNGIPHTLNTELDKDIVEIYKLTKVIDIKEKIFRTHVRTSMFNDINDFGNGIKSLIMALTLNSEGVFEIIEKDLNQD